MSEALVSMYDRCVNGAERSILSLLANRPRFVIPPPTSQLLGSPSETKTLQLEPFYIQGKVLLAPRPAHLPTISHILVHGSQATNDTCDFSDIDILVIINDIDHFNKQQHASSIRELQKLLSSVYAYDPLMHHGFMFLQKSALFMYTELFLPVETLRLAKVIHGGSEFFLRIKESNFSFQRQRVFNAERSLETQLSGGVHRRGDYQLKNTISGILLLPSLFLALSGKFVYKRESFALAKHAFSEQAWSFVAAAEQIRKDWIRPSDSWISKIGHLGHPAIRVSTSARFPTQVNTRRAAIRSTLLDLERCAAAFFLELKAALH